MHVQSLDKVKLGSKLGKTLFTSDGRVLLGRGVELTPKYINRLKDFGFHSIIISDQFDSDVIIEDIIHDTTRLNAILQVKNLFKNGL